MAALKTTSIKLRDDQKRLLRRRARKEGHGRLTTVIKNLIDEALGLPKNNHDVQSRT